MDASDKYPLSVKYFQFSIDTKTLNAPTEGAKPEGGFDASAVAELRNIRLRPELGPAVGEVNDDKRP